MTREQAINYLISSGFSEEQVSEVVRALTYEPTTKNDLGVDCISRADLYDRIKGIDHDEDYECDEFGGSRITYHTCDWDEVIREIKYAPSVTPQEPQSFEWCETCKEYDQEKHCCHRWSKVIRNTVEELKQEYIEREVLDKIRAEIMEIFDEEKDVEPMWALGLKYSTHIIDKYKAESEKV